MTAAGTGSSRRGGSRAARPGRLLMGIDIGTYSSKGVLTTLEGRILAQKTVEHGMSIPQPGWAEHDAESIWWQEFALIARALLETSGCSAAEVGAVAASAIGPCLLPVDGDGRPLRPGILYGIDTRATAEIADLNREYGSEAMYARGGSYLTTQAVGPKILWLRRHEPENYASARFFHSASDYIVLRLTGEHVMDAYTASLYNPLFDLHALRWSTEFAGEIMDGGMERLPAVKWATEIAGEVTAEAARATGLAEGTPVAVGTVDAVAEAVSVGAIGPGDLMCMYGTTAFFILAAARPSSNPTMWGVCHALPGLYGLAAGMATTGALTRWFRDNFARDLAAEDAYTELAREAATIPPGSLGLILLPYFSGERTPINDPAARGVLCGLTLAHTRAHVYRAVLEGTAYGIAHNLEAMRASGAEPGRIVAVGGGAKNLLWLQIVSDVSGLAQQVPVQTIGASYGDAFLAGYAAGLIPTLEALDSGWVQIGRTVEPDAAARDRYREYYALYRRLYEDTADVQHALARIAQPNIRET